MRYNSSMKTWVALLLFAFVFLPMAANALTLNLQYPQFPGAPNINEESGQKLESVVAWFYVAIVGISGLAAFAMIIWGGVQWMTSAGDPSKTGDAKDKIQKALLG